MSKFFLVGGAVRDLLVAPNQTPNDFDFVVEASGFESLVGLCKDAGFLPVPNSQSESGFVEFPEHLGIKALDPYLKTIVDIHCARREFDYRDRRHPAIVKVGSLKEDSSRRDFTCNALLLDRDVFLFEPLIEQINKIIDFHSGIFHINVRQLYTVGNALERFAENPDRVIRALRFAVKYGWLFSNDIQKTFRNQDLIELVRKENDDVKVKSLNKIFKDKSNYYGVFDLLCLYHDMSDAIFDNVGLEATNKKGFK
jgi:tRNA nucleotidyltransferase/poly(A) polymerase